MESLNTILLMINKYGFLRERFLSFGFFFFRGKVIVGLRITLSRCFFCFVISTEIAQIKIRKGNTTQTCGASFVKHNINFVCVCKSFVRRSYLNLFIVLHMTLARNEVVLKI